MKEIEKLILALATDDGRKIRPAFNNFVTSATIEEDLKKYKGAKKSIKKFLTSTAIKIDISNKKIFDLLGLKVNIRNVNMSNDEIIEGMIRKELEYSTETLSDFYYKHPRKQELTDKIMAGTNVDLKYDLLEIYNFNSNIPKETYLNELTDSYDALAKCDNIREAMRNDSEFLEKVISKIDYDEIKYSGVFNKADTMSDENIRILLKRGCELIPNFTSLSTERFDKIIKGELENLSWSVCEYLTTSFCQKNRNVDDLMREFFKNEKVEHDAKWELFCSINFTPKKINLFIDLAPYLKEVDSEGFEDYVDDFVCSKSKFITPEIKNMLLMIR